MKPPWCLGVLASQCLYFLGVPAKPSGFPLYLCSHHFRHAHSKYGLGTSTSSVTLSPSPKLVPETLAKDAAPIPNALAAIRTKQNPRNPEFR